MRAAGILVGAEVEAHLLLPQVVAASTSRSSGSLWPTSRDQASSSGMVSKIRYWWLITIIGTRRPNIAPTRAA
jgi:hypothetical protein